MEGYTRRETARWVGLEGGGRREEEALPREGSHRPSFVRLYLTVQEEEMKEGEGEEDAVVAVGVGVPVALAGAVLLGS